MLPKHLIVLHPSVMLPHMPVVPVRGTRVLPDEAVYCDLWQLMVALQMLASNEIGRRDIVLQVGKSYSGPREALRLNGKFVLAHLLEAAKLGGADLASSAFVLGLHQEVRSRPPSS